MLRLEHNIFNIIMHTLYKKLNQTDGLKIVELYKTKSSVEIAKMYSVHNIVIRKILKLNNIKIQRKNYKRKYQFNEHYFDNIDTEYKAYFLGLIAADGYIQTNKCLILALHTQDVHILDSFVKELNFSPKPKYYSHTSNGGTVFRLTIHSKYLVNTLKKYELTQGKSFTLPDIIQYISDTYKRHFLRGVFDGDGCFNYSIKFKKSNFNIRSGSYFFLESLQNYLIENLEINKPKIISSKNNPEGNTYYSLSYSGNEQVKKIMYFLYKNCNIFLYRKYRKVRIWFNDYHNFMNYKNNQFTEVICNDNPIIF